MRERYSSADMARTWSDESRFNAMLRVELAALEVLAADGVVPGADLTQIVANASVDVDEIKRQEATLKHETAAFVRAVGASAGPAGERWLHYGLTSSDVADTATALLVRQAGDLVLSAFARLKDRLMRLAVEHADTPAAARTHGRHATLTTFGARAASWYADADRASKNLSAALEQMAVGKLSGPVGVNDVITREQEIRALRRLSLQAEAGATQVVSRDRYSHLLAVMAVAAGTLERIAVNVRLMSQSEVDEVSEGRDAGQQGSSAMPHKVNPVRTERVVGLSRLLRSYSHAVMESQALWYERDLTHSSVERVVLPDAFAVLEFAANETTDVLKHLRVKTGSLHKHARSEELQTAALLSALVECGYARQLAHTALSFASKVSADTGRSLIDCVAEELGIAETDTTWNHLLQAVEGERAVAAAASTTRRIVQ